MKRLTSRQPDGSVKIIEDASINRAIRTLASYEDMLDNGSMLKFPCNVGSKAYCLSGNRIEEGEVYRIEVYWGPIVRIAIDFSDYRLSILSSEIGNSLFFTPEAARKKLEVGNVEV